MFRAGCLASGDFPVLFLASCLLVLQGAFITLLDNSLMLTPAPVSLPNPLSSAK